MYIVLPKYIFKVVNVSVLNILLYHDRKYVTQNIQNLFVPNPHVSSFHRKVIMLFFTENFENHNQVKRICYHDSDSGNLLCPFCTKGPGSASKTMKIKQSPPPISKIRIWREPHQSA